MANTRTRYMLWASLALVAASSPVSLPAQTVGDAEFEQANAAFERNDYAAARRGWEALAGRGDGRAMLKLGWAELNAPAAWGPDAARGRQWYERCAREARLALCASNLAWELANGSHLPRDVAAARGWYEQAFALGQPSAANEVGLIHLQGTGGAVDEAQARAWFRKGADARDPQAGYNLGIMLANGRGGAKDEAGALSATRTAAEAGHVDAMNNTAWFLQNGVGGPVDLAAARSWYTRAADAGHVAAKANLAAMPPAPATPVAPSAPTPAAAPARVVLSPASAPPRVRTPVPGDADFRIAPAPQNAAAADAAYARAMALRDAADARRDGTPGKTEAQRTARNAQWDADMAAAAPQFFEAAALGHRVARYSQANAFCRGQLGQSKDPRRCIALLTMLAEEGEVEAMVMLGRAHLEHKPPGLTEARYWFERAANAGDNEAMGFLGAIYDPAYSRFPDMRLAIFWHQMAASRGNSISRGWLQAKNALPRAPDEQAFVDRIDRQGPDRSDPANFAYEVGVYCQYRGPRCNALRGEAYRFEQEWNARADAANLRRISEVYRREAADPDVRTRCLQQKSESIRRATHGQQDWYYAGEC